MNTNIKLLLTVILTTAALTFLPHVLRAEGMEGGQGMMEDKNHEAIDVAIHGFCPVCVINGMKVKGKDNFVTEYKGKVYKFAGIDQQKMFLADPEKYITDLDAKFNALKDDGMMKKGSNIPEEGSH